MDFLKKLPIGQYVFGESGWLRRIDPRVKFSWIIMFLVSPVLSGLVWRIGVVFFLLIVTLFSCLPLRIWWRSLLFLAVFSIAFGLLALFLPTNDISIVLPIRSEDELPTAITVGPSWNLFSFGPIYLGQLKLGPLSVDRSSFDLGIKTSTLIFTVVHSVNLMLITTTPEDLMWTLSCFLRPLQIFGVPVDRLSFQLLLALRFLPLVQEELQNLLRSFATRSVDLKRLGLKASIGVFLAIGERFLSNILLRAEQGAESLLVRTGGLILAPRELKPEMALNTQSFFLNSISIGILILAVFLRCKYGSI